MLSKYLSDIMSAVLFPAFFFVKENSKKVVKVAAPVVQEVKPVEVVLPVKHKGKKGRKPNKK
jgi:hypothetical protein